MIGGIVNAIFGGASARKQAKMLESERTKNQSWYDRRYNETGTERADAQASLTAMRDAMRERSGQMNGAQAVAGGTEESVASEKEAQNKAMGGVVSNINVASEQRKDGIEAQYQARDADLSNQTMQAEKEKQAAIAQAGAAMDSTINSAISAFNPLGSILKK